MIEALDALDPPLEEIAVFGMNWNGDTGHTDFRDPTLVRNCCARCVIHPTDSGRYLPPGYSARAEQRLQPLPVVLFAVTVACCVVAAIIRCTNRGALNCTKPVYNSTRGEVERECARRN